ncbi:MAG: hypothetical protein V1733_02825 [bacterium]
MPSQKYIKHKSQVYENNKIIESYFHVSLSLFTLTISFPSAAQTVTGHGTAKALAKWVSSGGGGGGGGHDEDLIETGDSTTVITTTTLYYDSINTRFGVHIENPSAPMHVLGRTIFEGNPNYSYNRLHIGHAPSFSVDSSNTVGYLGFNVYRGLNSYWYRVGDQTHNGGSLILGNTKGGLYFGTLSSTGGSTPTPLSDAQLLSNLKMVLTHEGRLGLGSGAPRAKMEIVHADELKPALILDQTSQNMQTNEIQFHLNSEEEWAIGSHLNNDHPNSFFIWNHTKFRTVFMINEDSLVGINTEHPSAMLEVNGSFKAKTVGIGTAPPTSGTFKLYVEGGIKAREMKVTVNSFADHVFGDGYSLLPIGDLKQYILTHGRLPGIPSAEEVETEGVNLGEMQVKLLEKLEEQALYIIDLQKQIDELKMLLGVNVEEKK